MRSSALHLCHAVLFVQITISQLAMVPDPNPADSDSLDDRSPSKLAAAEQMCRIGVDNYGPAKYNYDKCGSNFVPDVRDPLIEVVKGPDALEQGDLEIANNTVGNNKIDL
jgi:hypothetical protein